MSEQTNERESERVPMTTTTTIRMWLCLCVCRSVLALFHSVANSSAANKNDPKLRQSLNMQFVSKLYVALPAHIFNIFVWLLNRHTYTHTLTLAHAWSERITSPLQLEHTNRRRVDGTCVWCVCHCVCFRRFLALSRSLTRAFRLFAASIRFSYCCCCFYYNYLLIQNLEITHCT